MTIGITGSNQICQIDRSIELQDSCFIKQGSWIIMTQNSIPHHKKVTVDRIARRI